MKEERVREFKGFFWVLLDVFLVFLLMFGLVGMIAVVRSTSAVYPARTITVSADGETEIRPDLATLTFSVLSRGVDAEAVQKENTSKMNEAIDFVKGQGVELRDIKTSNYNLYPTYRYPRDEEMQIAGYELRQSVTVKIRDLEKAQAIVGGLPALGVNEIGSLSYSVDDPESQRNLAREEAFTKAHAKAVSMASQNGVHLVRVVTFNESSDGGYTPYYSERSMATMGMGGDIAPSLEPGSEKVSVNVSVTYEIR